MTKSNDQIFNILLNEDEITWQSMIYNLVKNNEIDPWNVDVSKLSYKFIELINKLKEMDFRISGKVLLAATLLLKIKSNKLLGEDLTKLDNMMRDVPEDTLDEYIEDTLDLNEQLDQLESLKQEDNSGLIPRTPQPRERKVSIFDLVDALQRALDVKKKRVIRKGGKIEESNFDIPTKTRDITEIIRDVFSNVKEYFIKSEDSSLEFSQLLPSEERDDKIFTFLSLLHLNNEQKVQIDQERHQAPIYVSMYDEKKVLDDKELGE